MRRTAARVAIVVLLGTAACGPASTSATSTTRVRPAAPSSTAPSTTAPPPSALDGLRPFFRAAAEVDARLALAASAVNRDVTGTTVTLDRAAENAIDAADPAAAGATIPPGLPPDLERAVLVVYNDLVSRRGAFNGVRRNDTSESLNCLKNGAAPAARFRADVAAAERTASVTPPLTPVAPESRAAEELAVRMAWIDGVNNGCASCGGAVIRDLVPITIYAAPTTPPQYGRTFDGEIAGVYFTAGYVPGSGWSVVLNAC